MDPVTKTYVSIGLVVLAAFEFWAAMRIFGRKGQPGKYSPLLLRLHRIFGYLFAVYFVWIAWVCVDLMDRLADAGRTLDSRAVIHATLAMTLFGVFLVKISFIRMYRNYRPYVPMLGICLVVGTLVLWGLAGWMFLILL
ncbi:MAG: hypothetical protein HY788_00795 [Deltaproteobacteria bacterium]|nr:hypothetical protein [Deltaproteobacteria bacterium]